MICGLTSGADRKLQSSQHALASDRVPYKKFRSMICGLTSGCRPQIAIRSARISVGPGAL